jgi:phosphoribosylglycinamide formyltransferase-1
VVLVSGRGSNLKALLEANLPLRFAAVISNRPEAAGLQIAASFGVETRVIDHRAFSGRDTFDQALAEAIDSYQPDIVVLAGFMRILTDDFVTRYLGRLINIHPSLLPAFPGLNTHARALQEGVKIHGCTIHFVTPKLDHGPIIVQAAVPVLPDDDEERLAARVLQAEHRIFPLALRWFAENRLQVSGEGIVNLRGSLLSETELISPREIP